MRDRRNVSINKKLRPLLGEIEDTEMAIRNKPNTFGLYSKIFELGMYKKAEIMLGMTLPVRSRNRLLKRLKELKGGK